MLSSLANARLKQVRKLRRRSVREEAREFLAEGLTVVSDLLDSTLPVSDVFVSEVMQDRTQRLMEVARARGAKVHIVTEAVAKSLSTTQTPQGIVAVASLPESGIVSIPEESDLVVVLDRISDPGNAGTLVRSAVAAGADAVIFGADSVDPFGPKVVRGASGALFHTAVVRDADLSVWFEELHRRGLIIIGTHATSGTPAFQLDLTRPIAFVLGNEASGVDPAMAEVVDEVATIPMPGGTESLNVAVAGSILLYEAVRQREGRGGGSRIE